jgi:hypothetical protein
MSEPAPEGVVEALALLRADGYVVDFSLATDSVSCGSCGSSHGALEVEKVYRFEGASDPDDEEVVFGLRCPTCGSRGVLVSAYGPTATDANELIAAFVDRR